MGCGNSAWLPPLISQLGYLFPLHQLLVHRVWEGAEWTELASALRTHEDAILVDYSSTADGDKWHPVAAHVLIQVHVPTLDLGAG